MNSSMIISANETVNFWEKLMFQIGSTWTLDSLYLFFNTTLGLLGVVLNILSLFILFRVKQKQTFYKYMKIYTLNGVLVCLFAFMFSFSRAPRYLSFAFSLGPSLIRCYLSICIFIMLQFGNAINICILFERISNFSPRLEKYFKQKPFILAAISFIISFLLNLPAFFVYEIRHEYDFEEALQSSEKLQLFPFCKRTAFSLSIYGKVFVFSLALIKDFLYLFFEIILTFISLIYLRKFFLKKQMISSSKISAIKLKYQFSSNQTQSSSSGPAFKTLSKMIVSTANSSKTFSSFTKTNRSISIMSIIVALLSVVSNISSFATSATFIFTANSILFHHFSFIINITAIFRYLSNFFILLIFNKNFNDFILKRLRKFQSNK
jgi:hypothetical protein